MRQFHGLPASPGVVLGPAFRFERQALDVPRATGRDASAEWSRCLRACDRVREEIVHIRERAAREIGEAEAAIFDAHAMFVDDPALHDAIRSAIDANGLNAEAAVYDATHYYAAILEGLPDPTLSARAADVHDVGHRLLRALMNITDDGASLTQPSIVIAHELTPSDTVMMDRRLVLAVATEVGGPTSHAAILARSYGIPAIVGVGGGLTDITTGTLVAVDGGTGTLVVDPDEPTRNAIAARRQDMEARQTQAKSARGSGGRSAGTANGSRWLPTSAQRRARARAGGGRGGYRPVPHRVPVPQARVGARRGRAGRSLPARHRGDGRSAGHRAHARHRRRQAAALHRRRPGGQPVPGAARDAHRSRAPRSAPDAAARDPARGRRAQRQDHVPHGRHGQRSARGAGLHR